MKPPLKVLIFSVFVVLAMMIITLYRFDLIKFKSEPAATQATEQTITPKISQKTIASNISDKAKSNVSNTVTESVSSTQTKIDIANGKKLYESKTCILCHGADGEGNTPMGKAVSATNLTLAKFKSNAQNLSRLDYILQVIQNGVPGTAMVSFKDQIPNAQDRLDLASYVSSLQK